MVLGGIARQSPVTPQRSRQWAAAGPVGREPASREAIDDENGVADLGPRQARSSSFGGFLHQPAEMPELPSDEP